MARQARAVPVRPWRPAQAISTRSVAARCQASVSVGSTSASTAGSRKSGHLSQRASQGTAGGGRASGGNARAARGAGGPGRKTPKAGTGPSGNGRLSPRPRTSLPEGRRKIPGAERSHVSLTSRIGRTAGVGRIRRCCSIRCDTYRVAFDPYAPYGPVVDSTIRVVTWNVWGRYGSGWQTRQAALEDPLAGVEPDLVCLVEAWRWGESSQPERVARRLGLPHHHFAGDWEQEDWVSGIGLVSRWPMSEPQRRPLRSGDGAGFGEVVHVVVDGERGTIQLFAVVLDYPLDGSGIRPAQGAQMASVFTIFAPRRDLVIVCGDFNAGPDSDEIRMLPGRSAPASHGLVFYDSWEMAGDGSPGYTWSNRNPLAAIGLYPNRRFDYIFSAWPRRHGVGHPV